MIRIYEDSEWRPWFVDFLDELWTLNFGWIHSDFCLMHGECSSSFEEPEVTSKPKFGLSIRKVSLWGNEGRLMNGFIPSFQFYKKKTRVSNKRTHFASHLKLLFLSTQLELILIRTSGPKPNTFIQWKRKYLETHFRQKGKWANKKWRYRIHAQIKSTYLTY